MLTKINNNIYKLSIKGKTFVDKDEYNIDIYNTNYQIFRNKA